MADGVGEGLDLFEEGVGFKVFENLGAALGDGHALVLGASGVGHGGLGADYGNQGQIVALGDIEVVGVVGRGYFYGACAEFGDPQQSQQRRGWGG